MSADDQASHVDDHRTRVDPTVTQRLSQWARRHLGNVAGDTELTIDREQFEDVQAQVWALSPERRGYLTGRWRSGAGVLGAVVLFLTAAVVGQPPRTDREHWWTIVLAVIGTIALVYSTFPFWAARMAFNERRRTMAAYVASAALRDISADATLPLHQLFAYNRRQLDAYQQDARNQQRTAFRYALVTSILGLLVLLAAILASVRAGPGSEAYVATGLGGVGAALSAYVAATMLRISQRADEQVNQVLAWPLPGSEATVSGDSPA